MSLFIAKTVLDVRREPIAAKSALTEDSLQETQVLPGETVLMSRKEGDWAYIEALEQPCFKESWSGYKGWVLTNGLEPENTSKPDVVVIKHGVKLGSKLFSLGSKVTRSETLPPDSYVPLGYHSSDPRAELVGTAQSFLGMPYQWGGRSSYMPNDFMISSVDCSGLVNLCFLTTGMLIPRDAHDQWLVCKRLQANELKPGDLVFTAKEARPDRMSHVMMIKDAQTLIEASQTGGMVQEISIKDKLGVELDEITPGNLINGRFVFFGSLLD